MATTTIQTPAKVNLLLQVLGKRPDGFHELETILLPVPLYDTLEFHFGGIEQTLECDQPEAPVGESNLVLRAAQLFAQATHLNAGLHVRLVKAIPAEAGLGGGSSDAAATLLALNREFDSPLEEAALRALAAQLGADVPFFLNPVPTLARGRGEQIEPLPPLRALDGCHLLLVRPDFGVPTAWAYENLARFPKVLRGEPGRAAAVAQRLAAGDRQSFEELSNALEVPVFDKYPVLELLRDHLLESGALAALLSGSGSTVYGVFENEDQARLAREELRQHFGDKNWSAILPVGCNGIPA